MPVLRTRNAAPTVVSDEVDLPPKFPDLPEDVLKRFPSLDGWEEDTGAWWKRAYGALQSTNRWVSQTATAQTVATDTLRSQLGDFSAEISTEIDVITTEQEAQAKRIVTVSAIAGVSQHIKVQTTAPVGPALNDIWINTSDPLTPVTYEWDGVAWVEVTEPISAAAVSDERTARVTADGFLSGKYSLNVVAGDVITSLNISSSSGPGTTVSNVAWQADQFQIYSGTSKKTMFVADAVQDKVRLAGVFTVDGAGSSIYVKTTAGAGSFNSAGTPFFVDSNGRMSLTNKFVWDGAALSIDGSGTFSGSITATSGAIGGWALATTTLSANNAVLDSAGQLLLGTGNDLVVLSATDATYRIWIGNATAGSAAFRVTKAGVLSATGGSFSGAITSTSGTIAGFTIGSQGLSAGSGTSAISLNPAAGIFGLPCLKLGDQSGSGYSAQINLNAAGNFGNVVVTNSSGFAAFEAGVGFYATNEGFVRVLGSGGIIMNGDGSIDCTGPLNVGGMANQLPGNIQVAGGSGVNHGIQFNGSTNAIAFYWDSGAGVVKVYVDGTHQVME